MPKPFTPLSVGEPEAAAFQRVIDELAGPAMPECVEYGYAE